MNYASTILLKYPNQYNIIFTQNKKDYKKITGSANRWDSFEPQLRNNASTSWIA